MKHADLYIPGVLYRLDPKADRIPLVFDSPHSGRECPDDFDSSVPLDILRTSEDAYVDELFTGAVDCGATLLAALFPRYYIDPNRAADDIDAALFDEPWPTPLNPSDKTEWGMGLVRRYLLKGVKLYDRPLTVPEVMRRIEDFYDPYHTALGGIIDDFHGSHGESWHVNCHSMKPVGNPMNVDNGVSRPDFVISDREGETSDREFLDLIVDTLQRNGYGVAVNYPYKGAEIVRRHSSPDRSRHSVQIEINRGLYLNSDTYEKTEGFGTLKKDLDGLSQVLAKWIAGRL